MSIIIAHDPIGMLKVLFGGVLMLWFGIPLLYSVLAGISFMLAGIGTDVSWWRRLVAPGLCAVNSFVLVGLSLLLLFFAVGEGPTPVWVSAAYYLVALLLLLQPVVIGRKLLHFSWWRVVLASVLLPLLHVVLAIACGVGLASLSGELKSVEDEPQPSAPVQTSASHS